MIIDGRAIAAEIFKDVAAKTKELPFTPKLGVITCAPGLETRQYLDLKLRKAKKVGIDLIGVELPVDASTEACIASISRLLDGAHGVIAQLPLPESVHTEEVLGSIPIHKDPDGFGYGADERSVLPPVAAAIDHISNRHSVVWAGKKVAIVGYGKLVGQPAERYALSRGAEVTVLTESSPEYMSSIQAADILVLGVGQPQLITAEMVKDGVVVFDAGASEDGGVVVGDADESVKAKASLLTPVPGGIGPITVAVLFDNLLKLIRQ